MGFLSSSAAKLLALSVSQACSQSKTLRLLLPVSRQYKADVVRRVDHHTVGSACVLSSRVASTANRVTCLAISEPITPGGPAHDDIESPAGATLNEESRA